LAKLSKKNKKERPATSKKTFTKFFVITFIACVVVFTSGIGIFATILNQRPMEKNSDVQKVREQTEEKLDILVPAEGMFADEFKDSKRVNILLMGNTDEGLADTIMLASFDPEKKAADIISVPRDTYYERPVSNKTLLKINSIAHKGPDAMAQAVHEVLLGIPINYYAIINYNGVKNIIDSIGGVPMNIKEDMRYTSKSQNLHINIKAGEQVLDGDKAVQYLRFRSGYVNGDLGRVEAQQEFVKSAIKQAMEMKLTTVAKTVVKNVDSDITNRAILYLAGKAVGMDTTKVRSFLLPGASGSITGSSLSFWKRTGDEATEDMLRQVYLGDEYVTAGAITGGAVTGEAVTSGTSNESAGEAG
jgi:LCP family protein required for cell wall assembly